MWTSAQTSLLSLSRFEDVWPFEVEGAPAWLEKGLQ